MRLKSARIQNYRSIKDTGLFQVENLKTIFVGPNESGKTVILQALQQLNQPSDVAEFDELRDYPRSLYNDITTKKVKSEDVEVVRGYFELEDADKELLPPEYSECIYVKYKMLNNKRYHTLENAPKEVTYGDIKNDLNRLCAHISKQFNIDNPSSTEKDPTQALQLSIGNWNDYSKIDAEKAKELKGWLEKNYSYIDEDNQKEEERYNKLHNQIAFNGKRDEVLKILSQRTPVFVLFNNYFKVKPLIHLQHLADRIDSNVLDNDKYYDYGNTCLLKLLGFSARELSNIGATASPSQNNSEALKAYRDKLDRRSYQLDAASVRLTNEIKRIWNPDPKRPEADKLVISADGQYLKVVVEDNIGVKIELDQRSEGFQWLVSFYVVFFAEAMDKHKNAILLLDEPGMSLHGLKQREFRETISRLAENNQTIYTTHSPFLVGPNELDLVRVVELKDREEGTKVHTTISSSDPAGLLPLQEALGYDLAQSLFTQQKNLVLEGITDYWYLESTAQLLREAAIKDAILDEKTALIFANSAGKVVYYATILHAQKMKVAALLDSDAAGDQAAQQEHLVHALGNKNILRTKDFCPNILKPEIEDLLRDTLITIVKDDFGVDVKSISETYPTRPIVDIFTKEISGFSKYKLAKSYVRWTRNNNANALNSDEIRAWSKLIQTINKALK
ncbi:OLD family endonuclease [Parabacteroides sp. 20_3]|jgi:predicted ATP-dependent endonuclease of OLD family|uniref:AAA family ATPase n=1 Tax=Parabacteroides sp. 20_3 TaxID=469591 RepID=UPI000ED3C702|nr:AAA family ATPase [Parabacteroides sp. 20_3]RGK69344.1 OLD family endonuclease [Parabacteroides sp. 20_3]